MKMKHGLGKGMMALLDEQTPVLEDKKNVSTIDINTVIPNRYQPRKTFDEKALQELADSIREKGVIQPIIVSELGNGKYELVAGERRLRAAKMAGLLEIPAIVKDFSDEDRLEIALIENIQREDLNPLEKAQAYQEVMERLGISQEEFAKKIGKDRSSVANTLRLLKLPEYIKGKISTGEMSEGHARAILMIEDIDLMIDFANHIIEKGLSVREAENEARSYRKEERRNVSRETSVRRNREMETIQENFIKALGAKVELKGSVKKGKIEIHYFSRQELESIYKLILQIKR